MTSDDDVAPPQESAAQEAPSPAAAPAWSRYAMDEEIGAGAVLLADATLNDVDAFRKTWHRISVQSSPALPTDVTESTLELPGPAGAISATVFAPAEAGEALPGILLIHSGAFVGGSTASVRGQAIDLCREVGALVVAVEYRLAPEHPYPAAVDDCDAAWQWLSAPGSGQWLSAPGSGLNVDPARLAIHGTSAGGALAIAVALRARDRGGIAPRLLFLNSPELDDRRSSASMAKFVDTPGFTARDAEISWRLYLGDITPGSDEVPADAAPARAENLRGLPPTYLALMEFDPLRDEGLAFAGKLLADEVPVELHLFPGTFHGSSALAHAEVSRRELDEEVAVLRRALSGGGRS
ncbi:alpha/beta hydrolase [Microbacterium sp. SLBN-154]|uniref:alpha/beta hydrolase n=1 Tax=Microbacterium sp. SLBN-154 TaxID=2768458 RepID=UPI00190F356D|nr:alpha/beta hydrolase [Microbacterium sp. SLBN-154]